MENNLAKELRIRSASLGLPLSGLLSISRINRSSFGRWVDNYASPSEENSKKLEELIFHIKGLQALKLRRSKERGL